MRFSSLKVVDLASFCMSLLDDDALGSIVNSWPHLECLYLGTGGALKEPPKPKVTFQGLVTVLSSCLNLRELGLVFDATRVDPPTAEKPGAEVYNTNITTLHVGFSPIKQPLQVANVFSAILPNLTEVIVEPEIIARGRKTRVAKWGKVSKECVVMKQERLRF